LPRIILGDNVIVGAGAVVTKIVNDNVTVVGVPAKLLMK
jgi:maltose O-acetyltransferase